MGRELEPALLGDLDMNGRIDDRDVSSLVSRLGTAGFGTGGAPAPDEWNPLADLNADGRVDGLDVQTFLRIVFRPSFRRR